ncbi:Conserved_hypothetical protein [Hexamita inflata]|uniref:Uncharacterized protein n=1 Tax=Hexamita inflata TaxID=28002 RepID=A0AA86NFB8_9EUKA|nr:Conserved hypothetical protein [Hexamita inflata]
MRSQMIQFKNVMRNYNKTFNVDAVILGYGAHLHDIDQRVNSFLANFILCVCAASFLITIAFLLSIVNSTALLIYFSLVFLFSTSIIKLVYCAIEFQNINPFLFIFNSVMSMILVTSSMSVILLKLRTQFLQNRNIKQALASVLDQIYSQIQTNFMIVVTSWLLFLSDVEIVNQFGYILFFNGIIMTLFVVPFGFVSLFCLYSHIGLWPYKKLVALGE